MNLAVAYYQTGFL